MHRTFSNNYVFLGSGLTLCNVRRAMLELEPKDMSIANKHPPQHTTIFIFTKAKNMNSFHCGFTFKNYIYQVTYSFVM